MVFAVAVLNILWEETELLHVSSIRFMEGKNQSFCGTFQQHCNDNQHGQSVNSHKFNSETDGIRN